MLALKAGSAGAQISLPGATTPAPVGTVITPQAKPRKPRPAAVRAVAVLAPSATLDGKTYALNGGKSLMTFSAQGDTVDLTRLSLAGTKLSNGRDACQADVPGMPLHLTGMGKTNGLLRYTVPVPACPITLDVLDGAVLSSSDAVTCAVKEADCGGPLAGLWGALPGDLGPDQVKTIEHERTRAEAAVRAAYKGLVASTKDRAVIRTFASDQAGFSSHREETCRDYIGESRHGFCGTRLTQARAATLEAELVVAQAAKEARKKHGSRAAR